jgi:hypothetical protein
MLEIKSYDDWTEEEEELAEDPISNIKKYTDYVRLNYSKAGILNPETDSEIAAGVQDRLNEEVFTEDMTEEDRNGIFSSIVGPDKNDDADARFVLDYLKAEGQQDDARVQNLTQYLSMKQLAPDRAEEFRQPVADIIGDRKLVRDSRVAAADRGDFSVVAIEEDNGDRTFYSGPSAKPEKVSGEIDSLIKAGAISTSDLSSISGYVKPINGGLSTTSEATRYDIFRSTVGEKAKADKELGGLLQNQAGTLRQQKEEEQRTTGEAVLEGAKTVIAYPFVKLGDAVMAAGSFLTGEEKPEPKYAPDTKLSDVLGSDENLRKKFSAEEIEKFSDAMVADAAGAVFRADKPETGITTDSMGNPIIAAALLPRDDLFEKALAAAPLNKDQQKMARVRRDQLLDTTAPELLKVILEEEPDAVGMLAKAKADGLSDAEFVKTYVSDSKNYSGFETRLEQFGKSAWKTVAEIPLGLAALSGNEWAAKEMVKMNKDQSRRQEFSRMFGDEYGIGFQLLNTIPQVATDIGLTIGTGGVFAGAKTLAKAGSVSSKTALRSMAKLGLSGVDDVAAQSFRTASTAGGEAATSNAIKEVGRSLATKFAENAPVFTTSFVRSATSTYGSIYGQLPDEMSHEEKHKNALGYALAAGLSTGVITSGMSFLGRGGVEDLATKRIRAMLGGETDDAVLAAGGRVVPVDKMNYRQAKAVYENLKSESVPVTDRAFQRAMRGAIGGAYKNYMRTTFGGMLNEATEEMVDQAIQMKLEDAALDQETPLSEKVNQIFTAGVIGGGLGGIVAGATQFGPVKKSEQALVFEGRASALEKVATQLRKTNSNATAETVQRMIDDARTRAAEVTQAEAQAKIQEEKNAELATKKPIFADPAEKQLSDEKEQELELTMLGDLVGEKVSAAGFTGTLEADDSGSIFLNTKDGETIHLGSRYEKAQGRVSAFPQLMTFAKDEGKVLAGTPYIVRGKKATSKVAMPSVTENNRPEDFLGVIKDKGNIIQLVVKGATLMSNQDLDGMDIKISNGYQIKSLARYYNVSLDSLQDLTPPPTDSDVNASSIDEIETNAVSDEAKASIVTAKEVLQYGPNQNLFKAFMAGDSSKAKFKQTVTNLTPDELNFIAQNANTFFDWVSSDDTIPAETRGALLQSAEDLKSRVALAYKFQVDQAAKEAFANEPDLTDEEKAAIEDELKRDLEGGGEEATAPKTQLTSKEQEAENKRLKGVITGAPKEPTAVKTRKTPEGNSVVEGPSPQDQLRKLMADYSDMEFVVPIVATREGPKTFAGATKYRKKLEFLEDIAYSDAAAEEFSAELAELKVSMAKGKQAIGSRRRRLRMKMASLMPAEVGSEETTLTQSEQDLASQLSAIEASRPFKTFEEEEEAQEKRTKKKRVDHGGIAGEDWSTEDKLNVFRNLEEELAFNDLVLGGFRISDLSAYGKAIAGLTQKDMGYGEVPLFTKQRLEGDPTDPMKYLKGKHKFLYRKVIENYPLVTPTSKDEPVTSKRSYTNVETGEYRTIPIPVFRDASYDAVAGEFTNDPIIIREQIDQNIPVTIPKQLIKRSENAKDAFKINPSIEFDPDTGVVMSVIDPITRQPIRFSGEEAYVNGSYIPIKARKTESLLMSLVAPSGRYLSSAGETAKGRQSIGQQVVNNKVVPAKNLNARDYTGDFQKWMMGEVAFDGEFERGAGHRFLKSEFQLDDDSISDLSSYALAEYGLSVYEFAMGKALLDYAAKSVNFDKNKSITKRLTKAAEEKGLTLEQYKEHPDFASEFNLTKESLRDLNPVGVVADFFYTNSKEAMATAIAERHPNLSGSTAHNVITKYAEFLYERVNEPDGDLFTGPKNPLNILKKFGKDYQNAEKARNIRKTVFFRGMGEDNESVLDTLLATGKLNDYALDPLLSSSRDMVDDDPETATTYRVSLRDSLIRQINDTPELKRAMKDIALLFHKGFEVLESGEMIVDVLNNKIVSITGDNRDISMAIVNRLSGLKTGLRAAGVMSELGWLPPVAKFEAIPPTVEPPASFESPTASKDRLIELVDKAKESAYRAGGKTTPQEEVAYRSKIIEAVRVAQPEIQEAFAAAETLRRKGDLRERYEQSIKSVFNKMDTETINVAVNKLSQTISNNRSKLDKFDEQIELVNSEITEAGLSLRNIFNEINVQRRALGLGARPESELLADLSSEGEFKQPTAAELSSLERPQPTATPKQVKVKKTKAAERAQLALPQLTDSYNMALSNVRFHTRKKNSVTRDKEVSIALIERLNPLMQRIDDVMVDDMSETEKIGTVEAILTRALTGDPADTRAATEYKKASESMKLKASGIVEETTELKGYEKIARMAAPALMKMRNDVTRLNKSVSNVNSAELEQAARIANSEDVARYALESNDPESVLTALRIISKSKVEHHREVAKLLLLAPDFVRSVKFGIVDVRSDWAGIYDSESNAVMVNLSGHNGRGLADVLLHEYLHAATVTYLNDPRTAEQRAAVQRINQLRELAIAQATKKGLMRYAHVRNGLANNAEFLTYTITAPEFQSMLAAMTPTGQRSILSRMIDAILSFFGKKNTLLNKAIKELFDFSQMSLASYHTFNISSRRDIDGIVQIAQDARVAFEDKEFFDSLLERIQSDEYELEQKMSQAPDTLYFSVSDVEKLNTPSGISLQSFAAAFTSRIRPETKTYDQLRSISTDIIEDHIKNPEKYIVEATNDGISRMYRRLLTMPDGKEYDPDNIEHANASDRTIQIYNLIQDGGFDQAIEQTVSRINDDRAEAIKNFAEYLREESEPYGDPEPTYGLYDEPEAALLLVAASKYAVRTEADVKSDNGLRYRVIEMTSDDEQMPFVADAKTASEVVSHLRDGKKIKDAIKLAYTKQQTEAAKTSKKFGTGWYVFKKSDKHEDAVELNAAVAATSWCTGGSVNTAKNHLSGGDFHVFFENGKPEVAIRTSNGQLAEPPRGNTPNQSRTQKHEEILRDYLLRSDTGLTGAEDFIADREFLDRVVRDKGFSRFTNVELLNAPRYRRSSNGYGSDSLYWPESVYSSLDREIRKRQDIYVVEGETREQTDASLQQAPPDIEYIAGNFNASTVKIEEFPKLKATNLHVLVTGSNYEYASNLVYAKGVYASNLSIGGAEVSFPSLESADDLSVLGDGVNTVFSFPKLKTANKLVIESSTAELPALTKARIIHVQKGASAVLPELTEVETIRLGRTDSGFMNKTDAARSIEVPKLINGGTILGRVDNFYGPSLETLHTLDITGYISLPRLTKINFALELHNDSDYDLPNLTSVYELSSASKTAIKLPSLTTIEGNLSSVRGPLDLPELTTVRWNLENIYHSINVPKLTSIGGRIENVSVDLTLPALTAVDEIGVSRGTTLNLPALTTVNNDIFAADSYARLAPNAPKVATVIAPELTFVKNYYLEPSIDLYAPRLDREVITETRGDLADEDIINYIRVPERQGDTAIDVLGEIRRITPAGINIEINNTMVGAMGANATKPNTILVNENLVATMASGLSAANARAVVRTAVDEELAHLASFTVFTTADFAAVAAELGPDKVNEILDMMYSNAVPDNTERAARIAADREAGVVGDIDAAAEWVRMEITRMATGRTREADIAFFYTNPSLLERFLEGLKAFIVKLKQQFKSTPTTGTAARISQASRSFRKLRNGGVLPTPEPSAANEYGDTTAFFNAINGDIAEGQEDRTYFMFPVAGTGASKQKTKDFWKMAQDKMYNLPMELRKYLNMRDGTISQIEYTIEDFDRRFPKLRDEALARGASIEDIGMILGTTAPAVQGEARKEIQRKVREFKKDNATDPDLERKAEDYEAQLTQPEADKFFAAFRKEQQAMESKLKNSGFGELVDYLVEFRNEINKYKAVINFDESNDVYLTRTFRFFGSEGWALFAKEGGVAMIDGKEVDFNKLRAAAAKHFEWEVDNDAKQNGQTLTAEQRDKKLIEYLDKYLANLEQEAADAKDLGAMNTVRKDVNRLLRKKDFDAPLRTLLGEVTDPFENAVRTVYSVGRLAANEKFLRNFASKAIEIEVASRTRKPDMELLFPPSQSAQLGDLAGLYVRKDIAATIREELGMNGIKQQSKAMETLNSLGRAMSKFSGLSITAKTLGSVGFYPRNVLGGIALTTAQGIINPVYMKEAMRLSIISNMSLGGNVKADTQETRNQIRRLTELQILKDETRGRIAMDMLNGFVNSTDQQLEELLDAIVEAQGSGNIEKIIKKFNLEGTWAATKQAGGSTVEFLASLNNVIDSAFKLNAYFFELNALKEAYGDTESESKLEVDAARKVKLTFPTHSDQLSLAKAFNKSPFSMIVLPFVRWKTEVFRTMFNTVPLAVEEMRSGNPVMRSRGTKRLIGFTSTMVGGGAAYGALFATLFSLLTDDEDDERDGVRKLNDEELDALREGLPKWQRNHGIFAQLLQDGSVQVIDMSNILPYSQLTDLIGLATRGNLKGMADYIASEMVGTQIAASTAFEIAQNRDEFDQPIWLDTDNAVGALWKMVKHLGGGTVVPSVVDKVIKIGRYGEQNAKEIIVGELTGVRPMIHKATDIEYRGMRNLKESADAVVSLLYPLSSGRGLNPDEVEGIIDDHQSASNKNQQKLHNFLMGMQSIGSTESSLATTAKQMKFSKQRFGAALEGVNIPWVPNEQWFRKMIDNKMRVGEQDPDEIANEINRVLTQKADVYSTNFLQ